MSRKTAKFKKTNKTLTFSKISVKSLRAINFMLLFALIGVLFLYFSSAALAIGMYGSVEKHQVDAINAQRTVYANAPTLSHLECLNTLAENWTKKMVAAGQISHNPSLGNEINYCAKNWQIVGENVGVTSCSSAPQSCSESLMNAFLASPGHKANIYNANYRYAGVGAYIDARGSLYVTQIFLKCDNCRGNELKAATLPADPIQTSTGDTSGGTTTFSCPKVANMQPTITLNNLSQPPAPGDVSAQADVYTSTERRVYYYRSAGPRYSVGFYNHNISSISPNAPVVSGSHTHPTSTSHQVKLDYTALLKANPAGSYTPKITYSYIWNFTQSLWVSRYSRTTGALLYPPAESNGDGTGGSVTDQLTKTVQQSTNGSMNGPTLGPCN